MSEAMAARIAGAQLVRLDSAHISVAEQPQAFADALRSFIDGRCGG
jgi:pimeloyl-ACP methyl ester carboxylesterase